MPARTLGTATTALILNPAYASGFTREIAQQRRKSLLSRGAVFGSLDEIMAHQHFEGQRPGQELQPRIVEER